MKIIHNQMIDMGEVLRDARPRGIIECGAYHGIWWKTYAEHGIDNRCWIEACPDNFEKLCQTVPIEDVVVNVALLDENRPIDFVVTDNWQSGSILPLKLHLQKYPNIKPLKTVTVQGRTLDSLIDDGTIDIDLYDFVLMDLQGAEYYALKGFEKYIHMINYLVAEINYEELYAGCMLVDDFDKYLEQLGLVKQWATQFDSVGWGDAYYKRV